MTIKPVVTQKSAEKKEAHSHQESQNQNLVVSSVRSNHRNVVLNNKSSVEGQSPQRRGDVFEDISRHRRSPHKSGSRSKRDHHKREQRERDKVCSSPQYGVLSSCSSPHSSAASSGKSPKHVSISSGSTSGGQNSANHMAVVEETFSGYNSGDEHLMPKENLVTPDEWKDRDEAFVKAMSERGFIIKDIVEDGACLFRAISLQIYGDQEMHEVIRQQTMDYIYQNREYFAHFVTEDINTYVKRKRNKDSHGNHIEIQAMSEIYNRPVELYCYKTTPTNIFNSEQINNGYDPLRLSYQRGSHYNAILDPYNASVGVGLGLAGYKPESQTREAIRLSEQLEIEQTMFEDKLKTTDWEATNEAIEEQIARESYLQWCRENMQNVQQKASSTNGTTSSTVTSAEVESVNSSCSTSYSDPSSLSQKDHQIQQFLKENDGDSKKQQLLDKSATVSVCCAQKKIAPDPAASKDYCDSDDTDMSSSSSVEFQFGGVDKKFRHISRAKVPHGRLQRRLKRRRKEEDDKKSDCPKGASQSEFSPKRSKQNDRLEVAPEQSKTSAVLPGHGAFFFETTNYLPGTSKQADESTPVSQFYQSLLESSYTDDGLGQLSENEMVQKAIQMSRMDFIEEQRRKYGASNFMAKDAGDEDSDTSFV